MSMPTVAYINSDQIAVGCLGNTLGLLAMSKPVFWVSGLKPPVPVLDLPVLINYLP